MSKFFKSLGKGAKYVGLTFGAAAVTGVASEAANLAAILVSAGVPEAIAVIGSGYGVPIIGAFLATTVQQIIKHRDEIFTDTQDPV